MPAILIEIFELVLMPLLMVLTAYLIKWINAKSKQIQNNVNNDTADKYISMVTATITDCVSATTQTYVDTLKAEGKFDVEAQKIALDKTLNAVLDILSDDAKEYLANIYGDVNIFILNKIEAQVKEQKKPVG